MFQVKESSGCNYQLSTTLAFQKNIDNTADGQLGEKVFDRTKDDDKPALSLEDKEFIDIMEKEVYQNEGNSWVATFTIPLA